MKTSSLILSFVIAVLVVHSSFAQSVPPLINYQGKLTDPSGTPLPNGTYGVAFRIWNKKSSAEPANQLIWGQEYTVAANSGLFNVLLGGSGGTPISGAAVNDISFAFTDPERYFGLTVIRETNGIAITNAVEIVPRQQILSTPYSFRASSASLANSANTLSAPGAGPSNVVFVTTFGTVGIGTTNPTTTMEVNGPLKAIAFIGDGSQLTNLVKPSNTSAGTFSANTTYQNTSGFKLMVVWFGSQCVSGGWGGIKQRGLIGQTSPPNTQVAAVDFDLAGSSEVTQSGTFIVPNGWYWQVSNENANNGCAGSIQRIEAWQIQ